jgi:hypothetical protein
MNTKLMLTIDEAELLRTQHTAAHRGDILFGEIIMPNGKMLSECTFDYAGQIGDALLELSRKTQALNQDRREISPCCQPS